MDIKDRAEAIARLIAEADTDDRGNLLVLAGERLRLDAQGFTGSLMKAAGVTYGVNPKMPIDFD